MILVGCEFSGIVRDAFIARGYDAVSCDVEPSERPGPHIQDDIRNHLAGGWSMLIAFPPCTYLSNLNAPLGRNGTAEQEEAIQFVADLINAPIPRVAIENPPGVLSRRIRKPDQTITPYEYGEPWAKRTCLWLYGLPRLVPTNRLPGRHPSWHEMPGERTGRSNWNRSRERSRSFPGIAAAMAEQWGPYGA